MIDEILKLCNESGKLFSLIGQEVPLSVLIGKEIVDIRQTECSNVKIIIVAVNKLNEVYELIDDNENKKLVVRKLCISFETLDFENDV